jgi:hypothetical protein
MKLSALQGPVTGLSVENTPGHQHPGQSQRTLTGQCRLLCNAKWFNLDKTDRIVYVLMGEDTLCGDTLGIGFVWSF